MKKATHISLAQTLFAIEEDAYAALDGYLKSVRAHFESTEGRDEIIADIESRIAEQFLEAKHSVVTVEDVRAVIASMGHAEDFGGEPHESHKEQPAAASASSGPRKLYRNPDDRIIAGVCSGIAAYFGIDPLWVRIIFVVATFGSGVGVIVYVLLWVMVPEAASASQKLEMAGSPVTIETLSENVKEKIDEVRVAHGGAARRALALPFELMRKAFGFLFGKVLPFLASIAGIVVATGAFVGAVALTFLAALAITSPLNRYADFPLTDVATNGVIYAAIIGGYLTAVIPVVFLFLLGVGMVAKRSVIRPALGFTMIGIWAVALVACGVSALQGGLAYQEYTASAPLYAETTRVIPFEGEVRAIEVSGGNNVTLVQGDVPALVAKGREKDMDSVVVEVKDGVMMIRRAEERKQFCLFCDRRTPRLTLTLPALQTVEVSSGSRVGSEEWKSVVPMTMTYSSGAHGDFVLSAPDLTVATSSGASLSLRGEVASAKMEASSGSRIDGETLKGDTFVVTASSGARITVGPTEVLTADATSGAEVEYRGSPKLTPRESAGGSISPLDEDAQPLEPLAPIPPPEPNE